MLIHFYLFTAALFSSIMVVPSIRRWAFKTGTLDLPDTRKVHDQGMPRLGGVAIFLSFLFALLLFIDLTPVVRGILCGALVLFVTGIGDDLSGVSPRRKFMGEILGTLTTMYVSGLYISSLGNLFGFGDIILPQWVAIPFTLFAVVGVVNAINLLDGLDGLTGGVSVIALAGFALLAFADGNSDVSLLCATLAGAIFGFLKYNTYPARIFMGDVGSLVVGFMLAFLAICLTQSPGATVPAVVPLLILGLPVVDTLWVMSSRIIRGKGPFDPDKNHVHHNLMRLGFSHKNTVLIIYAITLFWMVVSILLCHQPAWQSLLLFAVLTLLGHLVTRGIDIRSDVFACCSGVLPRNFMPANLFRKLTRVSRFLVWPLLFVVLLFSLMGVVACWFTDVLPLTFVILYLMVGCAFYYLYRDFRNHFFQFFLFMMGGLLIWVVDVCGHPASFRNLHYHEISNGLFIVMAALVLFKILFRKARIAFLSSSLDLLVIAIALAVAIVAPQFELLAQLPMVIVKSVVWFLAIKLLMNRATGVRIFLVRRLNNR